MTSGRVSSRIRPMRRIFGTIRPVAAATAIEGLQQPVAILLSAVCFILVALQPVVQMHTFGDTGRLARDCGMGFLLVFGILCSAFTSGSTLAAEIRDGTAATALAKPVSRTTFLVGKFLGSCIVVSVFSWCQTWATLLAVRTAEAYVETPTTASYRRDALCAALSLAVPALSLGIAALVNARTRRRFGLWFFVSLSILPLVAAACLGLFARDGTWLGFAGWSPGLDARLVPLAIQLFLLLSVFCALATALTTRLATGPAVAFAFLVLFLGFLADAAAGNGSAGRVLYAFLPDAQHFWTADALSRGGSISLGHTLRTALYAATLSLAILSLGSLSFRRKDL